MVAARAMFALGRVARVHARVHARRVARARTTRARVVVRGARGDEDAKFGDSRSFEVVDANDASTTTEASSDRADVVKRSARTRSIGRRARGRGAGRRGVPERKEDDSSAAERRASGEAATSTFEGEKTKTKSKGVENSSFKASLRMNKALMACETVEELAAVVGGRASAMSDVNASTTYSRLAKFARDGRRAREEVVREMSRATWFKEVEARSIETMDKMQPRSAAQMAWACGHLSRSRLRDGDAFWDALERALERLGTKFKPQGVANVAWAYAKLEMRMPQGIRNAFETHLERNAQDYKPYELTITFWALTKHGDAVREDVAIALERTLDLTCCKPQELANVASAYARIRGLGSRDFLKALVQESFSRLGEFSDYELSMLLWGLSNAGSQLLDADALKMFGEVRRRTSSLTPHSVSLIAGAFATFNDGILKRFNDCDDDYVADSWCPSRFEESTREALRLTMADLESVFLNSIAESNIADLGFVIWAFARLSHRPSDEFVRRFEDEAVSKLDDCPPKHLANLMYGFSRLKLSGIRLFANATFCVWQNASEFTPIEIFTVCSALASENHDPGANVMVQLESTVLKSLDSLDSAALTEFLRVFAKLRYMLSPETFQAIARRAAATLDRYDSYRLSMTLWSHSTLGVQPHDEVLERFMDEVRGTKKQFLKHNYGLALWSLAVLAAQPNASPGAERLMRAIVDLNDGVLTDSNGLPDKTLNGLYMARLIAVGRSFEDVILSATSAVVDDSERAWLDVKTQDPTTSNLQRAVADHLHDMGVGDFDVERAVEGGKMRPDIVFESRRLVIEVDGPHHYSVDADGVRRELGQTIVRNELLRSWGWKVCVVPYHEWSELIGDDEREEYLRAKLDAFA